ncbi:NRDE family protein [Nocardiopsis sediminis]|uniref:NRDE family protein n=1 Tax=Nocardiopsis sediminis TaxID=1778267 RepID=A0ABV8FMI7_9ACTN
MCTVIVGFDPGAEVPLVVAAIRDELLDRPWRRPGRHWPGRPGLVGGLDESAGGTWLAVAPAPGSGAPVPRVGAVLNGRPHAGVPPMGTTVEPGEERISRGGLPLRAAATGVLGLDPGELRHYEPFHLLAAGPDGARVYGWDGRDFTDHRLDPGVTVIVNSGLDDTDPRVLRHTPVFARERPTPGSGTLRGATGPAEIWGAWLRLLDSAGAGPPRVDGPGAEGGDPSSLLARVDLGGGRLWASSSMTLIACDREVLRYAFTAAPGAEGSWRMVL